MDERRRASDKVLDELKEILKETSGTVSQIYTNQAVIKSQVDRIEKETIKTNGRVTSLEEWKNTKTGEFKIICWIVSAIVVAVIGAYAGIFIK